MPTDRWTWDALEDWWRRNATEEEKEEQRLQALERRTWEPGVTAGMEELIEAEMQFGAPERTESGRLLFTESSGVKRAFAPRGGQIYMELPSHYTNDYSPDDQKKIEDLYRQRSVIATDPDLSRDEDARQQALDEIDTEISSIPHLSPEMRQPTPQQQFNAALVVGPDGQKGTWDGSKFNPIESSKADAERKKQYSTFFNKELDLLNREESGADPKSRSMDERIRLAHERAQIGVNVVDPAMVGGVDLAQAMYGETLSRGGGKVTVKGPPGLEEIWPKLKTREDREEALQLLAKGWTPKEIIAEYKKLIPEK